MGVERQNEDEGRYRAVCDEIRELRSRLDQLEKERDALRPVDAERLPSANRESRHLLDGILGRAAR